MTNYTDHARATVQALIDAIDAGPGTWSAPWHHNGQSAWNPTNATTGLPYRAGNAINLSITALTNNWPGTWSTYKQWTSIGAQVRKGERGTRCVRWVEKKTDTTTNTAPAPADDATTGGRMVPTTFVVFNAAQVDGYQIATTDPVGKLEAIEELIIATRAVILEQGDRAFYRPVPDIIQVPPATAFHTVTGRYSTILHELAHWSGHATRLGRTYGQRFGDHAYAVEELTAELAAAMLTGRFHIANQARPDHAAYLEHWLSVLGEDPRHLFVIASQAQAAVDHILSYSATANEVAA